jgi:hypothetical protein
MKYEEVPVRPVMRYTLCECGGRLIQEEGAAVFLTLPQQWPHICVCCAERQTLQVVSPQLLYLEE